MALTIWSKLRSFSTNALRTVPIKLVPSAKSQTRLTFASSKASATPASDIEQFYRRIDLSFENSKEAFKSKTNFEIIRSLIVFRLCACDMVLRNSERLLELMRRILGQKIYKKVLKLTAFGQFVAGETVEEVIPAVEKIRRFGVQSILDYSVEAGLSKVQAKKKEISARQKFKVELVENVAGNEVAEQNRHSVHEDFADRQKDVVRTRTCVFEGEDECDKNCENFRHTIDTISSIGDGSGFIGIKLTALGRPQLLLKLSETIVQTRDFFRVITGSTWENLILSRINVVDILEKLINYGIRSDSAMIEEWLKSADFVHDGFVGFYDWERLVDKPSMLREMFKSFNIKARRMEPLLSNISDEEELELSNMIERIMRVIEHAVEKGIRVTIDAEQTYFQPAVDKITMAMMRRYNASDGCVLQTYQTYLKNCMRNVEIGMDIAQRENFHFGCKLVRGAYMEQERKRAQTLGHEDPVNENFETTSEMYDKVLQKIFDEYESRGPGWVSVMVASHNENTIRNAVNYMRKRNISPSEGTICFAQLYGMCDQVTFSLGQSGFSVFKYVPYGPIDGVLPYLSRRIQENSTVLKNVKKESRLLWQELIRRVTNGELMYQVPDH